MSMVQFRPWRHYATRFLSGIRTSDRGSCEPPLLALPLGSVVTERQATCLACEFGGTTSGALGHARSAVDQCYQYLNVSLSTPAASTDQNPGRMQAGVLVVKTFGALLRRSVAARPGSGGADTRRLFIAVQGIALCLGDVVDAVGFRIHLLNSVFLINLSPLIRHRPDFLIRIPAGFVDVLVASSSRAWATSTAVSVGVFGQPASMARRATSEINCTLHQADSRLEL